MSRIGKAYETLDQALVGAAGKLAQAYNWTTGRTKTDLANKMLTVAPILETAGVFMVSDFAELMMLAPVVLTLSHVSQKSNYKMEESEKEMMETGTINKEMVRYHSDNNFLGGMFLGLSFIVYPMTHIINDVSLNYGGTAISTGTAMRSASHYVMRSDSLPPRKNCISRLADMVKNYRTQPAMVPALATRRDNPITQNP